VGACAARGIPWVPSVTALIPSIMNRTPASFLSAVAYRCADGFIQPQGGGKDVFVHISQRIGAEVDDLDNAIDELTAKEARAVLLWADGPDFSHGGWPTSRPRDQSHLRTYMYGFNRLERLPIPVIAAVQGLCNGGGFELALGAAILFASERALDGHGHSVDA